MNGSDLPVYFGNVSGAKPPVLERKGKFNTTSVHYNTFIQREYIYNLISLMQV